MPPRIPDLQERFWERVDTSGDCWLWIGALASNGYGQFRLASMGGVRVNAHRFAYALLVGPIPAGLEIDHLCRNPACVNPAHLEVVTHRENTLRSIGTIWQKRAARTHCNHGHEFSPENTFLRSDGGRRCRTCIRMRKQKVPA